MEKVYEKNLWWIFNDCIITFWDLPSPKSGFKQFLLSLCGPNDSAKPTAKIYTNRIHQIRTGSRKYNSKIKLSTYAFLKKFNVCFLLKTKLGFEVKPTMLKRARWCKNDINRFRSWYWAGFERKGVFLTDLFLTSFSLNRLTELKKSCTMR